MRAQWWLWLSVGMLVGCGDDVTELEDGTGASGAAGGAGGEAGSGAGAGASGGEDVQAISVSGSVIDFVTKDGLEVPATVTPAGLLAAPTVSVTGAEFTLDDVPSYSVFHLLVGAPPTYRATYSQAVVVEETDIAELEVASVPESYLAALEAEFSPGAGAGASVVIVTAVDGMGAPLDGFSADDLLVGGQAVGQAFYLDATMQPDAALDETTASGTFVLYGLEEGTAELAAAPNSGLTIVAPATPVADTTVSLIEMTVTAGGVIVPTNVSFEQDVVPIFEKRGCENCHSGNSVGADLGNLTLNGSTSKIHKELTDEVSDSYGIIRVNVANPEMSLVLTMPGVEVDAHPNVTFASSADPDYLTLLGWITEGALEN